MENEQLKNESIASLQALIDYSSVQAEHSQTFISAGMDMDDNVKKLYYWIDINRACKEELELRIKQIFP